LVKTESLAFFLLKRTSRLAISARTQELGWHARNDGELGNILSNYCAGTYDRIRADPNPWQDAGVHSDIGPKTNEDRLDHQAGRNDRSLERFASVGRAENFRAGSPANVILELQTPRIEISLRANPNMIADFAGTIETSLKHRLGANENSVAELHGLRMLEDNSRADLKAMPNLFRYRPNQDSAHEIVEHTLALTMARVESVQLVVRVFVAERNREVPLPDRIWFYFFPAKGRRNLADGYARPLDVVMS
jgi:hypothetical protein